MVDNSKISPILPEPFPSVSVTRQSAFMTAQTDYLLSFKVVNAIPSDGFVRVIIPKDQCVVPTNGPICKQDVTMVTISCRIVFKNSAQVWIDINQPCSSTSGCSAGQSITIILQGLTNPSFFSANIALSNWEIYSMNSAKEYVDGANGDLKAKPDLIGRTAVIQALSLEENNVGRSTFLKVGIITGIDMNEDAVFDLYFPDKLSMVKDYNADCSVTLGTLRQFQCQYTSSGSNYLGKVTLM